MALYAWDNHKYMNVYIMNDLYGDGVTNNSGVSWYPDIEMTDENLARVVYNVHISVRIRMRIFGVY